MTAVKGKGNKSTEQALAALFRALHVSGWRRQVRVAGCCPDFVFSRHRIAVFADGCFWHGCPQHYTKPATRVDYWRNKIEANRDRDRRSAQRLRQRGFSVWRVWECRIRSATLSPRLLELLRSASLDDGTSSRKAKRPTRN